MGIMGGTFDPIHLGHLIAAERVYEKLGLDEVRFMPSHQPPHKSSGRGASPEQRFEMVKRAIAGHPSFVVSDDELKRGGTSYSIDTVSEIAVREPRVELFYIIGADMVMFLPKWYRIADLVERVTFVGVQRPGHDLRMDDLPLFIRQAVQLVTMPAIEISSTMIRVLRREGRSIRYLVPDTVHGYIKENQLYES